MLAIFLLLTTMVWTGNDLLVALQSDQPSRSLGTPSSGRLEHGKRLPSSGDNFHVYSRFGALLGRTSVHSAVRDSVLDAYADLARTHPELRFVLGETGWPSGGYFWPHRTHRNGLSVDFMVPLRNADGTVVTLPSWPWTGFGYDLEFDARGRLGDRRIDFEAMALHLQALDTAARRHGTRVAQLILAPEFLPRLWAAPSGHGLKSRIAVLPGPAWVRHDEHYHVEFAAPRP